MRKILISGFEKQRDYERPYISVGELLTCIRQSYFSRKKYDYDQSKLFQFPYVYLMAETGTFLHQKIYEIYSFNEVEKKVVSDEIHLKGYVDAILKNTVIDIKTVDEIPQKIREKDELQATLYSYLLNTYYGYTIDSITILYLPRNLKKIIPLDAKVDFEKIQSNLNSLDILYKSLSLNQPPEPLNFTDEDCKYCLYTKFCEKSVTKNKEELQKPIHTSVFLL